MTGARWRLPVVIAIVGISATAVVAALGGVGTTNAVHLIAYACAGAAAAGIAAGVALRYTERSSIVVQAVLAGLAPVLAVAVGVAWAASAMFLMVHDVWVLATVLTAAGTAGVITAVLLGGRVAAASERVSDLARQLGDDAGDLAGPGDVGRLRGVGRTGGPGRIGGPGELERLASELKATSTRLREARQAADANERSRRELVAWVSHDLRTPLAGVRAMIEALEDGVVADTETVARYHSTIRLETERLSGLVDDLFELSRIEAGALLLATEPVPIDELVAGVVGAFEATAGARGIQLCLEMSEPAPIVEVAVPEMVRALRNLLENAIRHTPDGEIVDIDVTGTIISISDRCGGIPAAVLPRVFELGYRGDAARTPGDGRGGLGLAVARGVVLAHEGEIAVGNTDRGCCFSVRLPVTASGPARDGPVGDRPDKDAAATRGVAHRPGS